MPAVVADSQIVAESQYVALRSRYLDLLQDCLTGVIYKDPAQFVGKSRSYDPQSRENGKDWPSLAHTMIGVKRLQNLRRLCEDALGRNIPGDFIETGVWRGGACILMRAILQVYGITNRKVFVADSFAGLPAPDAEKYQADAGANWHEFSELAVSLEEVRSNFVAYRLLDEQVIFLKGWFKDTLTVAPINQLAVLRLDGDMYESTMDAITALYPKVSPGGYVIVDDYHSVPACKQAVYDYMTGIKDTPEIQEIDGSAVYWMKKD